MTISDLKRLTEDEARELIEDVIWPNGPVCPHCGNCDQARIVAIKANKSKRIRAGLRRCKECRKTFTVTKGTLFEGSPLPLKIWVHILAAMCNGRKGIAARALQRELKEMYPSGSYGNYRNIWFACHRLRYAMAEPGITELLGGEGKILEADETLLGGKPRHRGKSGTQGQQLDRKVMVVSLVERGGKSRSAVVPDRNAFTLRKHLLTYADTSSRLMTDELKGYQWPGRSFASHDTTNHTQREYARGDVHSNTVESLFSAIKLSYRAVHHGYSETHTHRYLAERDWVYGTRTMSDVERVMETLKRTVGKRLYYKEPKNIRRKGGRLLGGQPQGPAQGEEGATPTPTH